MFVLSVEGPGYLNRGMWSTHAIKGVFSTFDEAVAAFDAVKHAEDEVWLVTDTDDGEVVRPDMF